MPSQESVDTERAVVTTYVPAYQKTEWEAHADSMDMSLSEFVRSMVQAGRHGFGDQQQSTQSEVDRSRRASDADQPASTGPTPGVEPRKMVLQALDEHEPLDWDELVRKSIGDLEDDVEEAIEGLQRENLIMHSGRQGGYVRVEE